MISPSEQDGLKKELQAIFSDGLVTVVGSGLSCAMNLFPAVEAIETGCKS
jgi:hypothetical protein